MATSITRGNITIGHYIPKWYGTRYNFISYGGVDPPEEEPPLPSEDKAIFIGRLEPDIGIMEYVEALIILKENFKISLELDIFGDGTLREWIEKKVQNHGLSVKLHGFVQDPEQYISSPRFAFASSYLAILDAMVHKRAIFSIYQNELKKDYLSLMPYANELLSISPNPLDLAEKVALALQDKNHLQERVERAYNFAKEQTWEKVAELYLSLYRIQGRRK